jgi:hypothetical protein
MTNTNKLVLPLAIQNFICLHKYVDVFLHNCANVTWGMKGIKGPPSFVLINFHKMCLLHFKGTNCDKKTKAQNKQNTNHIHIE